MRLASRALAAVLCLLASAGSARALTDEEIFREFRFNFNNPGARALGMGGVFVAIADDVTATQANPAGLVSIGGPAVFTEYRVIHTDTSVLSSNFGSLEVDPVTGDRDLPFLGLTSVSDSETLYEPTSISYAWPFSLGSTGRRLTLAASKQTVLSEDPFLSSGNVVTEARFSFESFPNAVGMSGVQAYSVATTVRGARSMEIVYWNATASLAVHEDFSFGYTLTYATLDLRASTVTEVEDPLELFLDPGHPRLPTQATTDVFRTTIDDTDSDFTYSFGIHWHPDSVFAGGSSPWRLGAVFRKGASFAVTELTLLNESPDETFLNQVVVPDRFAFGVSYQLDRYWLFGAEFERIEYSDLLKGFRSGVNFLTSGRVAESAFSIDPNKSVVYGVDDGNLYRVGAEYIRPFARNANRKIAVWAGYFRAPDSRIRLTQFNSDDPAVNEVFLDAFRGGENEDHFTAGVGYEFGRSAFQIAGDVSDRGSEVVGSYIFTVGGK